MQMWYYRTYWAEQELEFRLVTPTENSGAGLALQKAVLYSTFVRDGR
jgi:hypothetical protein